MLLHMSRLTTMGKLTALIAHEINQPPTGLVSIGNACLRYLAANVSDVAAAPAAINKLRFLQSASANIRWFRRDAKVAAELVDGGPGRPEVDCSEPSNADFATFATAIIAFGDARDDVVAARLWLPQTQ